MTTTETRMDLSDFPQCLMRNPREGEDKAERQFRISHNTAVQMFHKSMVGAMSDTRRSERAILSLAVGIDQWCGSSGIRGDCDYYSRDIVETLASAFNDALNLDLGRLDGGTLSQWICETVESVGGQL